MIEREQIPVDSDFSMNNLQPEEVVKAEQEWKNWVATNAGRESREEEPYTIYDEAVWKAGAERFHSFWATVHKDKRDQYLESDIGTLQAMFLGEKPATFQNRIARDMSDQLRHYGFKTCGDYLYDPDLVEKVIQQYPDVFSRYNLLTVQATMDAIAQADRRQLAEVRGLILGFPRESVQSYTAYNPDIEEHTDGDWDGAPVDDDQIVEAGYEPTFTDKIVLDLYNLLANSPQEQEWLEHNFYTDKRWNNQPLVAFLKEKLEKYQFQLNISPDDLPRVLEEMEHYIMRGFNQESISDDNDVASVYIHGVYWTDHQPSEESKRKQERLRDAFDISGILNPAK